MNPDTYQKIRMKLMADLVKNGATSKDVARLASDVEEWLLVMTLQPPVDGWTFVGHEE